MGKKTVVLELIFAHFRACPGLRIWHDERVDVLLLYTDLGRKFITSSTLNFRKFTSFPSKMKQRQRFQGVFNIPRCNRYIPIYRTQYSHIQMWYRIGRMASCHRLFPILSRYFGIDYGPYLIHVYYLLLRERCDLTTDQDRPPLGDAHPAQPQHDRTGGGLPPSKSAWPPKARRFGSARTHVATRTHAAEHRV